MLCNKIIRIHYCSVLRNQCNHQQISNNQSRSLRKLTKTISSIDDGIEKLRAIDRKDSNDGDHDHDNVGDQNYFGIKEDDYDLIAGQYVTDSDNRLLKLKKKYSPLLNLKTIASDRTKQRFGSLSVRLDDENVPKMHGQYDDDIGDRNREHRDFDQLIDHLKNHSFEFDSKSVKKNQKKEQIKKVFNDCEIDPPNISKSAKQNFVPKSIIDEKINFRFAQQFATDLCEKNRSVANDQIIDDWISHEQSKREPKKSTTRLSLSDQIASIEFEPPTEKLIERKTITGYEYLKQIKQGDRIALNQESFENIGGVIRKNKLDSKGFNILSSQIPDFRNQTNLEIVDHLERMIIIDRNDLIVLNKPYGFSVHGSVDVESNHRSLSNRSMNLIHFLPKLAERVRCEKLYTVHRLDRDTTGVLLLAKTSARAKQLQQLFLEQKIQKRYLCITKNTPDQPEGIIDIPIENGFVYQYVYGKSVKLKEKRERMVLCPEPMEKIRLHRRWREAKKAITYYRVLSNHGNAALLEVKPETGLKHQIRVHLGFGLRCPILGDHKYSNLDSLKPQKLPSDILIALNVRQAKAREVPMHLHAHQLFIPKTSDYESQFVWAPLPYHFRKSMRSLRLRLE
ncbi:hypothetical protein NH340_JMT07051 [Sarcoptes scabiei]|nr:hypothetical protein NH340_JMT07051 [Sarcoptes scabiei]